MPIHHPTQGLQAVGIRATDPGQHRGDRSVARLTIGQPPIEFVGFGTELEVVVGAVAPAELTAQDVEQFVVSGHDDQGRLPRAPRVACGHLTYLREAPHGWSSSAPATQLVETPVRGDW